MKPKKIEEPEIKVVEAPVKNPLEVRLEELRALRATMDRHGVDSVGKLDTLIAQTAQEIAKS